MTRTLQICGHRGARGLWPENTLEGFAGAFALEVDSVELDVALTADGIPVVVHDPALNGDITRTADGRWLDSPGFLVRSLSRAALHRYDVGRLRPGSPLARQFPHQHPRDGARVPALIDVLALARPAGVIVDIEIKTTPDRPDLTASAERMTDAVLDAVAAMGMADRVALRSFDWRALRHARRVAPRMRLAYITSARTTAAAALWWDGAHPDRHAGSVAATVAATGAHDGTAWAPEHRALTGAEVADAQRLGLLVMPWTANEPAALARLVGFGVDAICTDYPDRLRALLGCA